MGSNGDDLFGADSADDRENRDPPDIPEDLQESWEETQEVIKETARVANECGLRITEEEYLKRFDTSFITVTYNWVGGMSFADLMEENTQLFEGSVIRVLRRTEEILRQTNRAIGELGNVDLEQRISVAIKAIKRDIVCTASLYL